MRKNQHIHFDNDLAGKIDPSGNLFGKTISRTVKGVFNEMVCGTELTVGEIRFRGRVLIVDIDATELNEPRGFGESTPHWLIRKIKEV